MIIIFNNIYFYIFVALFIINIILKKIIKKLSLKNYISSIDFFKYLDKYLKNNNIGFTYFIIIIYILIAVLPFMILRFNRLGTSYVLIGLNGTNIDLIISSIFFILSFIYVFKILNFMVYEYIVKLHYYLHNKYEKYHDFVEDNIFIKEGLIYHYFTNIALFLSFINKDKKEFIKSYNRKKKLKIYQKDALKNTFVFYLQCRYFKNKYKIIKFITDILYNAGHEIAFHGGRFVYYIPYSLVCIALGVDIIKGNLYYIFYALLYLYITNMIKKVRKFYYEKDPVYDNILSSYFYNHTEYVLLGNLLEKNDHENLYKLRISNNKLFECIDNADSLIEYINSDFKVYYVTDIVKANNEKYIMNNYKRLHTILLLLLFNVYILYFNKYLLIILNIKISFAFINILFLLIIYYIHRQIAQQSPTYAWVENKKPQWYFRIIMFFYIVINVYIFMQNKFDPNVVEIIISFKDILIIKENFSLNEKYSYLKYYIEQLKNDVNMDSIILDDVFLKIINENYITCTITLEDIRNIVQELYNEIRNNLLKKEKHTFLATILMTLKKFLM